MRIDRYFAGAIIALSVTAPSAWAGDNEVLFNIEPQSPYTGSVWGGRYTYDKQINLKVFSDSGDNAKYEGAGNLQRWWNATGPDGEALSLSTKLDLDKFQGKPSFQIYGDWANAYPNVLSGEISLVGNMLNYDDSFTYTTSGKVYKYEGVDIVCSVNADCGKWLTANPGGVDIEFSSSGGSWGTFAVFANNPNAIEEIDQGPSSCFQADGKGVKVPAGKTCQTDDAKSSGNYTSLKVEDGGTLTLGGNLILDQPFVSFEVKEGAEVEGAEAGLVKSGGQTTVLKGAGTFSYGGSVHVQEGVLDIRNPTGLGSTDAPTIVENGATLRLSFSGEEPGDDSFWPKSKLEEPLVVNGGLVDFAGKAIQLKGEIRIASNGAVFNTALEQKARDGGITPSLAAKISGDGKFIKQGKGTLQVSQGSSFADFSGDFSIEDGTLALLVDDVIPATSSVDIQGKVTMYSQTKRQVISALSGSGQWGMSYEGQILRVGNEAGAKDSNFAGVIFGAGSLIKGGSSTFTLSGSNTYTGATTVSAGTLKAGKANAFSASSRTSVESGAILDLGAAAQTVQSLTLDSGLVTNGTLTASAGVTSRGGTVNAVLAGNKGLTVQSGTTTLNAANTYTGATAIDGGTLVVRGALADATAVSVAEGATYQVESNDTIGSLAGAGSVVLDADKTLIAGAKHTNTTFSGIMFGEGGFIKTGTGTTTFSGQNSYKGTTVVKHGVLLAGADHTFSSGNITVKEAAVLDLGGNDQQNIKTILLEAGELRQGSIGSSSLIRSIDGGIVQGVSGLEIDGAVTHAALEAQGSGVLELEGSNQFETLRFRSGVDDGGSVRINPRASLELQSESDEVISGSDKSDQFVIQGAFVAPGEITIDLKDGNDLLVIGSSGSISIAEDETTEDVSTQENESDDVTTTPLTIEGGNGADLIFDQSAQVLQLVSSVDQPEEQASTDGQNFALEAIDETIKVQNFEVVGVAGQGVAYFGDKPSFAVDQAEGAPPEGDYGLMLARSLSSPQVLTIHDDGSSESRTTAAAIALSSGSGSKLVLRQGNLEADLIYGNPRGVLNNSIELGFPLQSVSRGETPTFAKGRLDVGKLYGFQTIEQKGGLWSYSGDLGDADLKALGLVRVKAGDSASFASIEAQSRGSVDPRQAPLVKGRAVIAVSGRLKIGDGGISEQEGTRASLLVANGEDANDKKNALVRLQGESSYSGPTIVGRGARLSALNAGALSPVSKTLIGRDAIIDVSGEQVVHRLLIRDRGLMTGGTDSALVSQSIVNRGDINLDSIQLEDGMSRFLDRLISLRKLRGDDVPVTADSPLRKIKAQGSLKNLGGSIDLSGDLTFASTGDAGHALLNLSSRLDERVASIRARSITLSEANDVLINTGSITTSDSTGINFRGGNDLVLTKGIFNITNGSVIDGGETLDASRWSPGNRDITGLNIFKAYADPGVQSSDLVNWAAIKMGADLDWQFPQGGECRVTGVGNTYSQDALCVGLTGEKKDQFVRIDSGATLDAGVIALGRGSSNLIEVKDGKLHAILIEGAPGLQKDLSVDRVVLGDGHGGSGELIVGAITGVESIEQDGGTWSYGVKGVDDPDVQQRLIDSGRRSAEERDEMGLFPALSGYGTASVASVEIAGRDGTTTELQRAAFVSITGNQKKPLNVVNNGSELEVVEGIHGNASLTTSGNTVLSGESSYTGKTRIESGGELKAGNALALSPYSYITINAGGVLDLDGFDNTIAALSGGVRAAADPGVVSLGSNCTNDDEGADTCPSAAGGALSVGRGDFSGVIEDVSGSPGALIKVGIGTLTLSGVNQYVSPTLITGGVLKAGADFALSPNSKHTLLDGVLDLRGHQQVLAGLDVRGGVLRAESNNPVNILGSLDFSDGRIVAYLNNGTKDDGANAPINVQSFNYQPSLSRRDLNHGIYAVVDPDGRSGEDGFDGTWRIIEGEVPNAAELATKTHLIFPVQPGQESELDPSEVINVDGQLYYVARFDGLDTPLDAAAFKKVVLEKGSLNIVVSDKTTDEILNGSGSGSGSEGINTPDITDLPGCEGNEVLCESLQEDQTEAILEGVAPDDDSSDLVDQLPMLHWGQLATLLGSGLSPRNVDAAGRGLQAYNNVLADTIFDRHPLRRFTPAQVVAVDAEPVELEVEPSTAAPVRGLWKQSAPVADAEADAYLQATLPAQSGGAASADATVDSMDLALLAANGVQYQEDPSLTAQLATRDGWRAWYRGFAANDHSYASTTLSNPYSLYTGGFVLGADLALSESFQLGVYANYGDVTAVQNGSTGGGSWSPDGWGAGVTADYWTENFYVQGVLGGSGFSGTQKRSILSIADEFGSETASAEKSATSWLGALRFGAPFSLGSVLLEPQLTGIWTQNQESSFTESGVNRALRLRYHSRTTNYLQTGLGMKVAWPISTGDRAQWVPSVKVAWLADWDLGNGEQRIGYSFTDREVGFNPEQQNQNGALIEAGLDYTIANLNSTSFKVYAKGGAEIWGGDRGTNWRASGGVTFQF